MSSDSHIRPRLCFFSWVQGYNGSRAEFINRDTVCFKCGNTVKFVSEDGHESVFAAPGDGIGVLAVHSINKVFAVADVGVKPTINIYQYPSFRHIAALEGELTLQYPQDNSHQLLFSVIKEPENICRWHYECQKTNIPSP